jgi:hypothetical protein
MDLSDILSEDTKTPAQNAAVLSTGKPEAKSQDIAPAPGTANAIQYNRNKADLEYKSSLVEDLPFIKRAIDKIKAAGYDIEPRLSDALIKRHNGEKVFTLHEADTLLRGSVDITSPFFQSALRMFTAQVVEEDAQFTTGVFELRARYNKGIEWYNKSYKKCSDADRRKGVTTLIAISAELYEIGLPLHEEEAEVGFHREFLKPEQWNWTDFTAKITNAQRTASIATREAKAERHNLKKEEACPPPLTDEVTPRYFVMRLGSSVGLEVMQ